MKKIVMRIDEFEGKCGYSYRHEPFCNGGHNCKHPEAAKEYVNGEKVGYCYAFSCPLAPLADEDDFKDARENLEEYEEDMYVVLHQRDEKLMKLKCPNCCYEFEGTVELDNLGWHSSCPKCEASFDVDVPDGLEV